MANVLLIFHLIIALILIGAVLLQRSEGGGLGMGGDSSFMSNRSATTALNKLTWILAIIFLVTSLILTILAANKASRESILDTNDVDAVEVEDSPILDLKKLKALPKDENPSNPPKEY
ncbi:MAG: preprotein translocase subunit SecG [Rhodobacteraceae bacterium]|nr:MAG: preprotein translocase subunit SecG [Paracoccaceae bacterium]|tara:strand:+ start:2485 stop:2838 length:354 start_codon:yes stop_codon:yes gene_type:complete